MDISDTTNSSGASQHSKDHDMLRERIMDTLKDFDVLSSKRRITKLIFKYGCLLLLVSCSLYFIVGALFGTRLCQLYMLKTYVCDAKTILGFPLIQNLVNLIIGHNKLFTGSVEIVFLIIGAILLLRFFRIWRGYVPKTLQDLFSNKRIDAVRINDNWKHDDATIAARYLRFLDDYSRALSKPINYLLGISGILYTIIYTLLLSIIVYPTIIHILSHFAKFHNNNIDILSLFLFTFSLMFFAIVGIITFYSFGTILSVIVVSGKYLRELVRDFHITSNPTHLDHCGGLKRLGKFCLWLILPMLAISLFFLAYDGATLKFDPIDNNTPRFTAILYIINFGVILLLCVLAVCIVIWAAWIPLWKIHVEMIDENEIAQQKQSTEISRLEKRLQDQIDQDQLDLAKITGENLALEKTLNTSYPKWPFTPINTSVTSIITVSIPSLLAVVLTWLLHMPQGK